MTHYTISAEAILAASKAAPSTADPENDILYIRPSRAGGEATMMARSPRALDFFGRTLGIGAVSCCLSMAGVIDMIAAASDAGLKVVLA